MGAHVGQAAVSGWLRAHVGSRVPYYAEIVIG
jgi:hypothetical protein